jgi:hypothetical protein
MQSSGKRTVQVNVKMSREDFALLKEAAQTLWPDAVISNSGMLLGLAKLAAKRISDGEKATKPKRR